MKNTVLEERLKRAYELSVIQRYKYPLAPENLKHDYIPTRRDQKGHVINFDEIYSQIASLCTEVETWYCEKTGKGRFDRFNLGEMLRPVQEKVWNDKRFKDAFQKLGLDWEENHEKANLPWWNEVGAGEMSHDSPQAEGDEAHSTFVPIHTLETQVVKGGVNLPVKAVSTCGIIRLKGDGAVPEGYIAIGARGGTGFRNCYHLCAAGYLRTTSAFKEGTQSIYEGFVRDELCAELGAVKNTIINSRCIGRVFDFMINYGGPEFIFEVNLDLTREQLLSAWQANRDEDKREHLELMFIPDDREAIKNFIQENYRGVVANRSTRTEHERLLIHPGALGLALYSDMAPEELRKFYRPGVW